MEGRMLSKGILLLWFNFLSMGFAEPEADKEALLDFLAGVTHGRALNWRDNTSVCKEWSGVVCDPDGSHVVELRLPGRGFNGQVPSNTLSRLSGLRILSLRSNRLSGTLPPDFSNLTALTGLHLQFNGFSGRLPSDFSAWKNLTMLDLSHNAFEGSIPGSISNLTHLASLNLSNNSLSGRIPELLPPNLQFLNLSSNHLEGSIPKSLLRFPHSSFSSNQLSPVFPQIHSPSPPPISHPFKRNVTESSLLGIIVGGSALAFVAFAVLLLLCFSSKKYGISSPREEKGHDSSEKRDAVNEEEHNRLVFFQGCSSAFDLEDLLRASAEVLGKGSYGTSYKAVLEDATTVVVKRLKEVSVGRREFEQQMEMLGNIRHDNVVGLKAYYFSKDEKLLVYDYYSKGSVYSMLHGKRDEARAELDWETRLQIAIGAATAIAHIHSEQGGKLVHGNIKSSNVFLNHRNHGCLSDLGLATMATPAAPRVPGYRAPEALDPLRSSHASDVYAFGVLALELLTGRSPVGTAASGGGGRKEAVHLVRWVHSVVREEWTAEVFDARLMTSPEVEEEMVEMLRVALACVARAPEQRPGMGDVVAMIEDVRQIGGASTPSVDLPPSRDKDQYGQMEPGFYRAEPTR